MAVYTEAINLISISEEDTINEYYTFNLLMENFDIEVVNEGVSLKPAFEKIKVIWKKFKEWVKKLIRLFKEKIKEFKIKFENWFANNIVVANSKKIRNNDMDEADKREKSKERRKKIKISYYKTNVNFYTLRNPTELSSNIKQFRLDINDKTDIYPTLKGSKWDEEKIKKYNKNNDIKFADEVQSIFENHMSVIEKSNKEIEEEKYKTMNSLNIKNEKECVYDDSTEEAESLSKKEIMKYIKDIKNISAKGTDYIISLSDELNYVDKSSDEIGKELQLFEKEFNDSKDLCQDLINIFNKELILFKESLKFSSNLMTIYQELMKEIFTKNQYNKIQYMKLGNIIEPGKFKTEEQKEEKKTSTSSNSNKNTVYGYLM